MRKLNIVLILMIVLISPFFGWFGDSNEIDELIYVISMGIDKGEVEALRVTIQLPTYGDQTPPEGLSDIPGYVFIQAEGPALMSCLDVLTHTVPRWLDYMQVRQVAISEELARSEGFATLLEDIALFTQIHKRTHMVIVREDASEFIQKQRVYIGARISKTVDTAIAVYSNNSSIIPATLADFAVNFYGNTADPVAIYAATRNEDRIGDAEQYPAKSSQMMDALADNLPVTGGFRTEYFGTALFDKQKMVHVLTGYETQVLNMVRGEFSKEAYRLEREDMPAVEMAVTQLRRPKIRVDLTGEAPHIQMEIFLDGTVHQRTDDQARLEIGQKFEEAVARDIFFLMSATQQLGIDPGYISDHACKNFLTHQQWLDYNWAEKYPQATWDIRVNVELHEQDAAEKAQR